MCDFCGGTGMINTNPGDNSLGLLSELLNSTYCQYCVTGRNLEKKFHDEVSTPSVRQRTLTKDEAYEALGIRQTTRQR